MRGVWGARSAVAVFAVAVLSGCQALSGADDVAQNSSSSSTATRSPSGYGALFLAVDECSSFGTTSFTEVPCGSERAAARVIARHGGRASDGPPCPATTDFVLHISESEPDFDEDGDGSVPRGFACMRNLEPPHPGDPGGGGGPRTIAGDCVYGAGEGEVRETSCDGKRENPPEYQVTSAVGKRSECPSTTELYVQLGGSRPVGCARPV
ncbi:hypothetical protein [Streptomyces sp. NPDC002845]